MGDIESIEKAETDPEQKTAQQPRVHEESIFRGGDHRREGLETNINDPAIRKNEKKRGKKKKR